MQNKTKILSTVLTVVVSAMLVAGVVLAATTVGTNISTDGTLTVNGTSTLVGATAVSSTLGVTGATTITGALYANGGLDRSTAAALAIGATNATAVNITPATTITGALTVNGATATFGNAVADTVVLNGRVSTSSVAGDYLDLDSTYAYAEGASLKYKVTNWTGIGSAFTGLYVSPRVYTASASASLKGLEVNTSNGLAGGVGVALGQMHGAYLETQVKPIAASATVGPIYGIESQISLYAPTAGTLTLTKQSNVGAAAGRFQLGINSGLADYTSLYGVLIQSNDGSAASRTLGSGLLIRNYPAEGTQTWTKGIQITAPAVTGLSLEGAMTTGINIAGATTTGLNISGAATTDISLQNGETIKNSTDGIVQLTGEFKVVPTRVDESGYAYLVNVNDGGGSSSGAMTGGAATKTYAINASVNRPTASAASGDSNDSVLKLSYNNYAANDSNFIIRGVNSGINNRSGGTLGILEGGSIGAQNKSGGTSPTVRGLTVTPENYGTTATEFGGIDVVLKNEANTATTTYGIRVRNADASAQAAIQAGYLLSNTATNGFTYGLDMNGATIGTADLRLHNGALLQNDDANTLTVTEGNVVLTTARTVAASGENHGLDVNFAGTLGSASGAVAGNFVMTTAGTAGSWASGVYAKVVQGTTKNVNGYLSGAEFEVVNTNTNPSDWFPLVLNANSVANGTHSSYIALRDYGSTKIQSLFWFGDDTVADGGILKAKTAAGAVTHTLKILVGDTPYWIMLSNVQ